MDEMFGKILICLPSKHQGGDEVFYYRDDVQDFEMIPSSGYGFSWVILTSYAGPEHKVEPVLSGYKIALVYNLIHGPTAALLKARADNLERLHSLLDSWARAAERSLQGAESWASEDGEEAEFEQNCPSALLYLLKHKYSAEELSFAGLNGMDESRVMKLKVICRRLDCEIFWLRSSKRTHEDDEDYEDEEDYHDPESIDHPVYGKYSLEF
ncbi:hypothetical protein EIK77_010471 [Talaromyces pinophilus]|nr:hypothetical protein EIK77_010471 [Talaromyces pinophilus]PCH02647.1 hypothetical protein PENOC_042330 [Penicillium occitanis (nom. inval.)]PCH03789.1 Hypothetical protein PENO1_031090 [Penicillium occitanis (nom. inval.)]